MTREDIIKAAAQKSSQDWLAAGEFTIPCDASKRDWLTTDRYHAIPAHGDWQGLQGDLRAAGFEAELQEGEGKSFSQELLSLLWDEAQREHSQECGHE